MVEHADFYSAYRTYPHIDWGASGARCAEWLDRVVAWKHPARALRQAPFLIPVTTGCTYVEPAGGLYEELKRIEAETGVHLSLNMGFPPADIRDVGPSVIAYGADQKADRRGRRPAVRRGARCGRRALLRTGRSRRRGRHRGDARSRARRRARS